MEPDYRLQNYIYCYRQLKTIAPLTEEFKHRVVADACIDIFFEPEHPDESYVMGFSEQFIEFALGQSFTYAGIRFLPAIFSQLFQINAKELSNRVERLSDVASGTSGFIEQHIGSGHSPMEIKNKLDDHFIRIISKSVCKWDHRFYESLLMVLKSKAALGLEQDLKTGLSQRQLRRLFDFHTGAAPKTFSKVIRFQNLLKSNAAGLGFQSKKILFDLSYFDQSHMLKEFRNYYGTTPAKALRK